jgi:Flp pilus assembly protein protease CpaA
MLLILLIIFLVLVFGGGGSYYGYRRWGTGGGIGVGGTIVLYLVGGLRL